MGEQLHPEDTDRTRGILTPADREYLINKPPLDAHTDAQKRYRIRNRVRNALLDFTLLIQYLDANDREQIFTASDQEQEREYFAEALQDTFGFVCQGCEETSRSFELLLRFGLEDALARNGTIVRDLDVTIEYEEGIAIAEARALKQRGGLDALLEEGLTRGELAMLLPAGVLTDEEYEDLLSRLE